MIKQIEIRINPSEIENTALIESIALKTARLNADDVTHIEVVRRSIDARKSPKYVFIINLFINEKPQVARSISEQYKNQKNAKKIIIVGAGPAGYFAALELIELGYKPIVLERGKDVQARRKDLRQIQQFGVVNPHSNYCFGEGGAGTYSDGKLYTRATKRGDIKKVLQQLVDHGAKNDILIDAHPHIGSNKLPVVVQNIRHTIESFGGEVHFDSYVTDFILHENTMKGVLVNDTQEFFGEAVILATGHSARDIFELLNKRNILIEAKPFAMGVRIEHPQPLIDEIQYNQNPRSEHLPASSYSLVCQAKGRGVFSFCMCPGGFIVPASTAPGELVINGMSLSRRDSPFANSGMVVSVDLEDLKAYKSYGPLAGLEYQKDVEQTAFKSNGDGSQKAPAQRLTDFVNNTLSTTLPETSYIPGMVSAPLHHILPKSIAERLQSGFVQFGKKMKGYYTHEAKILGVESRTSSPVRIPREKESLEHPQIKNLYPCGEGAGYAGGIISAAMDGQRVARIIATK